MSQELYTTRHLLDQLIKQYPKYKQGLESALSEVDKVIDVETARMAKVLKDGKVPDEIVECLEQFKRRSLNSGRLSTTSTRDYRLWPTFEMLTNLGILDGYPSTDNPDYMRYEVKDETAVKDILRMHKEQHYGD